MFYALILSVTMLTACTSGNHNIANTNQDISVSRKIASPEVAENQQSVSGKRARKIYEAFSAIGVFTDCGAGTCGIEVSDMTCLSHGSSTDNRTSECKFNGQSERGSLIPMQAKGAKSDLLLNALSKTGLEMDCGMGTCGLESKHVICLTHNNSLGRRTYNCTIDLADGEP